MLSRDQIKECSDRRVKEVEIEEWGGSVRIQSLSVQGQVDFEEASLKEGAGKQAAIFAMILACAIDEKGDKLFKPEDVSFLQEKSPTAILKLFNACLALNAIKELDINEKAKN